MALRIVLLGGPGAGKGTQAKLLADAHRLPHISTGDIFRAHLSEGTSLGGKVRQYLDAGQLVPDDLTCEIVADRLAQDDCRDGFILDGFPRTLAQAEQLEKTLAERNEALSAAINIEVSDDEIVERLAARRSCPKCGKIFNRKFSPSTRGEFCDNEECDGVKLIQRSDDKEETIRERLRIYHENTEPIIEYYRQQGLLYSVSGTGSTPEDVFQQIESVLDRLDAP